jgi:hypothetical protein
MFGDWYRKPYYETSPNDVDSPFALALAELEPDIQQSISYGTPGMLRIWGQNAYSGLGAKHSYTPEFGCQPGMDEARLDEMGANYARALYRALAPASIPEPASGVLLGLGVWAMLTLRTGRGRRLPLCGAR